MKACILTFSILTLTLVGCGGKDSPPSIDPASSVVGTEQTNNSQPVVGLAQVSSEKPETVHKLSDFARNTDGTVKQLPYVNAKWYYCIDMGMSLPDVRKLVDLAVSFGAKGIVNSCDSHKLCEQIWTKKQDGSPDTFFYSREGYQTPAGELGQESLWSSSAVVNDPTQIYILYGKTGRILYTGSWNHAAVRCVPHR